MEYVEKTTSELYPVKDVVLVIVLALIVIPVGVSLSALFTSGAITPFLWG